MDAVKVFYDAQFEKLNYDADPKKLRLNLATAAA